MKAVVCTLAEGSYHSGAGALINSLHRAGYRGRVYYGYRGALPAWATSLKDVSGGKICEVAEGLEVHFLAQEPGKHFTHTKHAFMLQALERQPDAQQVYYFDSDIVVKCRWQTMQRWTGRGISLVEDAIAGDTGYLPAGHPLRAGWQAWLTEEKIPLKRSVERYYNAGYLGLHVAHKDFLSLWQKLNARACQISGNDQKVSAGRREDLFYIPDQDALNVALMAHEVHINGVGPEGMDFLPRGFLLSHAVRHPKPWLSNFFLRAFIGRKPSAAETNFVKALDGPLRVFGPLKTAWKKLSLKIAKELSRF